jgi:flavin reductase (DIM6/NTAB) family NADH-FMN oxidoreductase RutF
MHPAVEGELCEHVSSGPTGRGKGDPGPGTLHACIIVASPGSGEIAPYPELDATEGVVVVSEFDARELRDGFGEFLTGVTVVTTVDADGEPTGLTANSFSSLSLDPPLALFSIGKTSNTFEAFEAGNGFVIHVLAADQRNIATQFSTKGIDRFEGIEWSTGYDDLPVIAGTLASFECSREHTYEGGDHLILVGRIQRFAVGDRDRPALGYFRSKYISQV